MSSRWVLITGEYPPTPGGVSDYSRQVAQGLAEAGDEVHVWAPGGLHFASGPTYPSLQLVPGGFGPRDLETLDRFLRRLPKPYRLLVQYVPHAFGCKGMNIPFCWWLSRRPEPVWIMFHEVVFPMTRHQPLAHNFLGLVTRLMVRLVARKAERIFVTIPSWEALLPNKPHVRRRVTCLAVPSNIPTAVCPQAVGEIRRQIAPANEIVIGHFGTYGPAVADLLMAILPGLLLMDSRRRALLVGMDSDRFAFVLRQENPDVKEQIRATGCLRPEQVAVHLAACNCLVQPFIDGVSSRRTSLMAGLALGLPIVTNAGPLTDPVWHKTDAVVLAASSSPADIIEAVEELLEEPSNWKGLGLRAADFYQKHFALARTIQTLRREAGHYKLAS